jgi:methionyl-tRNA formyltransferase
MASFFTVLIQVRCVKISSMVLKIIFMGSPDFSVPILGILAKHYSIVGVVTQPDKPAGRGRNLTPSPIKKLSQELRLPLIQPRRLKEPEVIPQLQEWNPDLIVVAAFGQILRPDVLNLTRYGCINVHASLLPRWRGASPIQAAILNGDENTGITIMQMDPGVDTGPILDQRPISIEKKDTAGTLSERLSFLGADLLIETLPKYLDWKIIPQIQNNELATHTSMLKKEDGELDLTLPAVQLVRKIRAYNPWPGAYSFWQGQLFKVHFGHSVAKNDAIPGQAIIWDGLPAWGTGEGLLVLDEVQPAGKKTMPGSVFLNGARTWGKNG